MTMIPEWECIKSYDDWIIVRDACKRIHMLSMSMPGGLMQTGPNGEAMQIVSVSEHRVVIQEKGGQIDLVWEIGKS